MTYWQWRNEEMTIGEEMTMCGSMIFEIVMCEISCGVAIINEESHSNGVVVMSMAINLFWRGGVMWHQCVVLSGSYSLIY